MWKDPFSILSFTYARNTFPISIVNIKEKRPYKTRRIQDFLGTFQSAYFLEQHLLCELYLHDLACFRDQYFNFTPYVGDVQFRAFVSFVQNQVVWKIAYDIVTTNEGWVSLCIRNEPKLAEVIAHKCNKIWQFPDTKTLLMDYQDLVLWRCLRNI